MALNFPYFLQCQESIRRRNQRMKKQAFTPPPKQKTEGEKMNEEMKEQGIKTFFK